ncbi:21400_t:CDS:2 [Gigaspora rosea]|nr:21400_t:CDS:2 [Gigaspora rosea]
MIDKLALKIDGPSTTVVVTANGTREHALGKIKSVKLAVRNILIPTPFQIIESSKDLLLLDERETKQPIHLSQTEEGLEGTILQRTFDLVNIIPMIRNEAVKNVHQQQIKDKTYHDQKYHLSAGFDIEEKVLLENASKRKYCKLK